MKLTIVLGAASTEEAKITGKTPELLILIGYVFCSLVSHCYTCTRCIIDIGIFLIAPSVNTTKTTIER